MVGTGILGLIELALYLLHPSSIIDYISFLEKPSYDYIITELILRMLTQTRPRFFFRGRSF